MRETVAHFMLRMPAALHDRLAERARRERVSLNALIVRMIDEGPGPEDGDAAGSPVPRGGGPPHRDRRAASDAPDSEMP
ncbi:toxin-antitoxin system HicB family antitoxin [Tautonia plasticadhaerens]|uniref:HicB family protein n=1 Tax=Tautonia plasticadhaerens TaxID=2527974 RepID=A0A518H0A7_9BACT|nr:toxin-antitoxin system HicB family antitoxin [Tautonia plasticadhaerens]QDV34270.1 HicB family protein [Tautonia plasticadhaerens]